MDGRARRRCRISCALGMLLVSAEVCQAGSPRSTPYRPTARVYRYDAKADRILRYDSAVTPSDRRRPGGDLSYHGNRLTQSRYFGNWGEGGYYEAFADHVESRQLDGRKYQYRIRR